MSFPFILFLRVSVNVQVETDVMETIKRYGWNPEMFQRRWYKRGEAMGGRFRKDVLRVYLL